MCSESSESDGVDLAEASSAIVEMRSYALRVRSTGLPLSPFPLFIGLPGAPSGICSFTFLGNVRAQFSHGMALFLSFSSYVFRKLESRR